MAKIATRLLNFWISNFCNNKTNNKKDVCYALHGFYASAAVQLETNTSFACLINMQICVTVQKNVQSNDKGMREMNFVQEQQTVSKIGVTHGT